MLLLLPLLLLLVAAAPPAARDDEDLFWSDGAYLMSVYQLEKALNPAYWLRRARLWPRPGAGGVDAFGEPADPAWFTPRHGRRRLSAAQLAAGPGGEPPAFPWVVERGKTTGENPGFVVRDARGRVVFVKFDPPGRPGLASNGELLVSRLLHAAGYHVPSTHHVWVDPARVSLSSRAVTRDSYNRRRPMTADDLAATLAAVRGPDGRLSAVASPALPGEPKGPFGYLGRRRDDPADTVDHEDRRELRGLQVLFAWVNNTDARGGNTLDTWIDGALRHHLIDFSASFGSGNSLPKALFEGHEYAFDPAEVAKAWLTLGARVKPWERLPPDGYPELGPFTAEPFDPERWKPSFANPAFERRAPADGFWGARLVSSFTDEDLDAVLSAGVFPTPGAREHLRRTLSARRDAVARRWLCGRDVSALDAPRLEGRRLSLEDLGERGGCREGARYRWSGPGLAETETSRPELELPEGFAGELRVRTRREGGRWGRPLRLTLGRGADGRPAVTGLLR